MKGSKLVNKDVVEQLFVVEGKKGEERYSLNENILPTFGSAQEAAKFLVEVIRTWKNKGLFLNEVRSKEGVDVKDIPEDDLELCYRMFRGEPAEYYFRPIVALIQKILPDFTDYNFVKKETVCDCGCGHYKYVFSFKMLKFFATGGMKAIKAKEALDREASLTAKRQCAEDSVVGAIKDAKISKANMQALVEYTMTGNYWNYLKVVSKNLVICDGQRNMYSGTSGVGKFCQIHVWYKGQADMQEWQWRDCLSADKDRRDLYINGIGKVTTSSKNGQVEIRIELLNRDHGSRYTTFTFRDMNVDTGHIISKKEQAGFARRFETEIQRALGDLEKMWTRKNDMLTNHGRQKYRRPSIKQQVLNAPYGIGAFVTEEQIDHRTGGDPQVRFELFLMRTNDTKAKCVLEDHSYEKSDGIRVISILGLTSSQLTAGTFDGPKTIKIGRMKA